MIADIFFTNFSAFACNSVNPIEKSVKLTEKNLMTLKSVKLTEKNRLTLKSANVADYFSPRQNFY